jgi:integration host factor subunit beta
MTKSELIRCIAERFPALTVADTEAAVDLILNKMTQTLASGNRIEIRGFGSFALNYRPPRAGRNPKTGQRVDISAKYVPHFKAGKELRNRVDVAAVPTANQ